MDAVLPLEMTLFVFLLCCGITALGGFVKGAVGFAQPLVMISGMGVFLPPQIVVAGIIIPIVVANLMQVMRAGGAATWAALIEFRLYIGIVCVMILVAAQFVAHIPGQAMFLVLGIPVVVLCLVQLLGFRPKIPVPMRTVFSVAAGVVSGVLGGLAGTWGPPTVLYLLAVETPKAQQMAAQGVIYGLGALALLVGHLQSGILGPETWRFSAALVVPSFVGMWIGFQVQDKLDQERFRKATLVVLTFAGLNLVRKGIWG